MRFSLLGFAAFLVCGALAGADLNAVKAEPDLNKRAEHALDNADQAFQEARDAYHAEDASKLQAALQEVRDSADVCYDALTHTTKDPHKNKHYKKAELKLRSLLRMMSGFRDELPFDQRDPATAVIQRLQEIHDKILDSYFEKK